MTISLEDQHPLYARATLTSTRAVIEREGVPSEIVTAGEGQDLRAAVVEHVTRLASGADRQIELRTVGDRGDHRLLITPAGDVTRLDAPPLTTAQNQTLPARSDERAGEAFGLAAAPMTRREARPSFLTNGGGDAVDVKPESGWRAVAAALGWKIKPAPAEVAITQDRRLVAQHWPGCHKLAVVNVKGGQGKTPTAAMVSAVFARFGGGAVLAWDNSETLGTLGWRTESGPYDTTVRDMLPAAEELLSPGAGVSAIARYVHHQTDDRYDVLRSSPALFGSQSRITAEDFDRLVAVVERYYRMVIFDSGKDESGERWLRMLDATDQLIIPVLADVESAEGVRTLLEELGARDERSARLAADAVVVVSEWPQPVNSRELSAVVGGLSEMVRAVEVLPFDPSLKNGALRFERLKPQTQDVYVKVAAHAARGMAR
jgi:MinD-like ATPase involved in chromosome partitioning or flagellar assembly